MNMKEKVKENKKNDSIDNPSKQSNKDVNSLSRISSIPSPVLADTFLNRSPFLTVNCLTSESGTSIFSFSSNLFPQTQITILN